FPHRRLERGPASERRRAPASAVTGSRVADYNPGDAISPGGAPPMQRFFDTDQHITPPPDFYAKHMPAKFKDVAPHVVDLEDGSQAWSFDGGAILHQFGLENTGGESPTGYSWAVRYDKLDPAYYDPKARIDAMDRDGVAACLLFASTTGAA